MSDDESCLCWKTYTLGFFLLIALLFKIKNPLQYYIKFAVYFCVTMTVAFLMTPFVILRPNNPKNVELISMTLGNVLRIFGLKIEIENEKYLQITQPYILIVNHQSSVDFITMMNPNIWPGGNCTALAKKELLYTGPFGLTCWLSGITFIDRLSRDKSRGTMDDLAKRINDENLRVWIFPEGTRHASTELLPFKKGSFHLAIQAQCPIVCMVVSNYQNFFSKSERKFNFGGYVKCRVLPPFQTKGMTADNVNQLVKLMQTRMQREYDSLNEEIGLEKKYLRNVMDESAQKEESGEPKEDFLNLNECDFNEMDSSMTCDNLGNDESGILSDDNNNSITEDNAKKFK